MIAVKAHYDGKVIVPDEPVDLPKGEPLIVQIKLAELGKNKRKHRGKSVLQWLEENAVANDGLPADLAHQHDHYLYGTPKKPEARP